MPVREFIICTRSGIAEASYQIRISVIGESLVIKGRKLYAFTHGRSLFTMNLP